MSNMRDLFPGYYRPSEEDFADLWRNCIFAFDANVLLDLYRYNVETRENLLKILESVVDRLWLPYQTAYEYQKNRVGVIQDQSKAYSELRKILDASRDHLKSDLDKFKKHPFVDVLDFNHQIEQAYHSLEQEVDRYQKEHDSKFPSMSLDGDEIRDRLDLLFNGKVGAPYDEAELAKHHKEGENRYKKSIPPGFLDKNKEENKYGDLIVWLQVLDHAISEKRPIVIVTNDAKEDWWSVVGGKTISPRPELIAEMYQKTGQKGYIYSVSRFMEYARIYLAQDVTEEAIEEVKMLQQIEQQQEAVKSLVTAQRPAAEVVGAGWSSILGELSGLSIAKVADEALIAQEFTNGALEAAMAEFRAIPNLHVLDAIREITDFTKVYQMDAMRSFQAYQQALFADTISSAMAISRVNIPPLFVLPSIIDSRAEDPNREEAKE